MCRCRIVTGLVTSHFAGGASHDTTCDTRRIEIGRYDRPPALRNVFFKAYPGAATKNKSEANGGRFHKEYEPTGHGVREELVLVAAEMQFIALL